MHNIAYYTIVILPHNVFIIKATKPASFSFWIETRNSSCNGAKFVTALSHSSPLNIGQPILALVNAHFDKPATTVHSY